MSKIVADGNAPASALGDTHVGLLPSLPGGDRRQSQPAVPQRKKEPDVAAAATQVTVKTKPRHLEQHRPRVCSPSSDSLN